MTDVGTREPLMQAGDVRKDVVLSPRNKHTKARVDVGAPGRKAKSAAPTDPARRADGKFFMWTVVTPAPPRDDMRLQGMEEQTGDGAVSAEHVPTGKSKKTVVWRKVSSPEPPSPAEPTAPEEGHRPATPQSFFVPKMEDVARLTHAAHVGLARTPSETQAAAESYRRLFLEQRARVIGAMRSEMLRTAGGAQPTTHSASGHPSERDEPSGMEATDVVNRGPGNVPVGTATGAAGERDGAVVTSTQTIVQTGSPTRGMGATDGHVPVADAVAERALSTGASAIDAAANASSATLTQSVSDDAPRALHAQTAHSEGSAARAGTVQATTEAIGSAAASKRPSAESTTKERVAATTLSAVFADFTPASVSKSNEESAHANKPALTTQSSSSRPGTRALPLYRPIVPPPIAGDHPPQHMNRARSDSNPGAAPMTAHTLPSGGVTMSMSMDDAREMERAGEWSAPGRTLPVPGDWAAHAGGHRKAVDHNTTRSPAGYADAHPTATAGTDVALSAAGTVEDDCLYCVADNKLWARPSLRNCPGVRSSWHLISDASGFVAITRRHSTLYAFGRGCAWTREAQPTFGWVEVPSSQTLGTWDAKGVKSASAGRAGMMALVPDKTAGAQQGGAAGGSRCALLFRPGSFFDGRPPAAFSDGWSLLARLPDATVLTMVDARVTAAEVDSKLPASDGVLTVSFLIALCGGRLLASEIGASTLGDGLSWSDLCAAQGIFGITYDPTENTLYSLTEWDSGKVWAMRMRVVRSRAASAGTGTSGTQARFSLVSDSPWTEVCGAYNATCLLMGPSPGSPSFRELFGAHHPASAWFLASGRSSQPQPPGTHDPAAGHVLAVPYPSMPTAHVASAARPPLVAPPAYPPQLLHGSAESSPSRVYGHLASSPLRPEDVGSWMSHAGGGSADALRAHAAMVDAELRGGMVYAPAAHRDPRLSAGRWPSLDADGQRDVHAPPGTATADDASAVPFSYPVFAADSLFVAHGNALAVIRSLGQPDTQLAASTVVDATEDPGAVTSVASCAEFVVALVKGNFLAWSKQSAGFSPVGKAPKGLACLSIDDDTVYGLVRMSVGPNGDVRPGNGVPGSVRSLALFSAPISAGAFVSRKIWTEVPLTHLPSASGPGSKAISLSVASQYAFALCGGKVYSALITGSASLNSGAGNGWRLLGDAPSGTLSLATLGGRLLAASASRLYVCTGASSVSPAMGIRDAVVSGGAPALTWSSVGRLPKGVTAIGNGRTPNALAGVHSEAGGPTGAFLPSPIGRSASTGKSRVQTGVAVAANDDAEDDAPTANATKQRKKKFRRTLRMRRPPGTPLGLFIQNDTKGIFVSRLVPGALASLARPRIREGDRIVKVCGEKVEGRTIEDVSQMFRVMEGDVVIEFLSVHPRDDADKGGKGGPTAASPARTGAASTRAHNPAPPKRPAHNAHAVVLHLGPGDEKFGVCVTAPKSKDGTPVVPRVSKIDPDTPAARAGEVAIAPGDAIIAINGEEVTGKSTSYVVSRIKLSTPTVHLTLTRAPVAKPTPANTRKTKPSIPVAPAVHPAVANGGALSSGGFFTSMMETVPLGYAPFRHGPADAGAVAVAMDGHASSSDVAVESGLPKGKPKGKRKRRANDGEGAPSAKKARKQQARPATGTAAAHAIEMVGYASEVSVGSSMVPSGTVSPQTDPDMYNAQLRRHAELQRQLLLLRRRKAELARQQSHSAAESDLSAVAADDGGGGAQHSQLSQYGAVVAADGSADLRNASHGARDSGLLHYLSMAPE